MSFANCNTPSLRVVGVRREQHRGMQLALSTANTNMINDAEAMARFYYSSSHQPVNPALTNLDQFPNPNRARELNSRPGHLIRQWYRNDDCEAGGAWETYETVGRGRVNTNRQHGSDTDAHWVEVRIAGEENGSTSFVDLRPGMRDDVLPVRVSYAWEEVDEDKPWLARANISEPAEIYTDGSGDAGGKVTAAAIVAVPDTRNGDGSDADPIVLSARARVLPGRIGHGKSNSNFAERCAAGVLAPGMVPEGQPSTWWIDNTGAAKLAIEHRDWPRHKARTGRQCARVADLHGWQCMRDNMPNVRRRPPGEWPAGWRQWADDVAAVCAPGSATAKYPDPCYRRAGCAVLHVQSHQRDKHSAAQRGLPVDERTPFQPTPDQRRVAGNDAADALCERIGKSQPAPPDVWHCPPRTARVQLTICGRTINSDPRRVVRGLCQAEHTVKWTTNCAVQSRVASVAKDIAGNAEVYGQHSRLFNAVHGHPPSHTRRLHMGGVYQATHLAEVGEGASTQRIERCPLCDTGLRGSQAHAFWCLDDDVRRTLDHVRQNTENMVRKHCEAATNPKKFLADLRRATDAYNGAPNKYALCTAAGLWQRIGTQKEAVTDQAQQFDYRGFITKAVVKVYRRHSLNDQARALQDLTRKSAEQLLAVQSLKLDAYAREMASKHTAVAQRAAKRPRRHVKGLGDDDAPRAKCDGSVCRISGIFATGRTRGSTFRCRECREVALLPKAAHVILRQICMNDDRSAEVASIGRTACARGTDTRTLANSLCSALPHQRAQNARPGSLTRGPSRHTMLQQARMKAVGHVGRGGAAVPGQLRAAKHRACCHTASVNRRRWAAAPACRLAFRWGAIKRTI